MNRHYVTLSSFCLFIASGCATESTQRYQFMNESVRAESFTQNGQHKQAASLYQTLATSNPEQRNEYNILASESFIQSGDISSAESVIASINTQTLNAEQGNRLNLILIQIDLSQGETEKAFNRLNITQPYQLSPENQIIFYQSLAFAHSLSGQLLQSADARIKLTPLLQFKEQQYENNRVILDTLNLIPPQQLNLQQTSANDTLSGWIVLAKLLKHNNRQQNSMEFQVNLSEWQRLYPNHPADVDFIDAYSKGLTNTFNTPTSLAILLPESGRFKKAAEAIKIGIMEAYHQTPMDKQPSIRFYDSSIENIVNLYHLAISEGAQLVIGPLNKDNIQELALSTNLTTPVLALNHVVNLAKSNLFQFGLSPIDEVKQIVNKAQSDGIEKALILAPETNHGHRMADYLSEYWQQSYNTVLEIQHYNNKANDFSASIKSLLNLDESQYRHRKIQNTLGRNIEFTERRRTDVDAIFLSASAQKARSIYPQLQFHRATQVPVYALPQVYSGDTNPSMDIDLNSIAFCDIPWVFSDSYPGELSKESLRDSWQHLPNKYLRLIALGIDSFQISSKLEQLSTTPFSGATGSLSIDTENRITRKLVCAKFIKGLAVIQAPTIEDENQQFDMQDLAL